MKINIGGYEMDIFRGGLFLLLVVTMFGCSSSGISDLSKRSSSSASVQPVYEASKAFADIPIATNDSVDIKKSLLLNTGEQWIGRAVIKSSQNIEDAFAYYQANMPDKGWRAVTSVQSEVSILTFEKMSRFAAVQIQSGLVTVTVSPRETEAD